MRQTEFDPLIRQYDTFTTNTLRERRSGRTTPSPPNMHFPQHHHHPPTDRPADEDSESAAVATRGTSRQSFYRDRIPQLPSESRDNARNNLRGNVSTESSDSSASDPHGGTAIHPSQTSQFPAHDGIHPQRMPSPQHNEYGTSHRRQSPGSPALESRTHGRFIRTENGALVEVSEEVYAVRRAALAVLDPITYCWVRLLFFIVVFTCFSFLHIL